jgi:hypothetical protein
MLRTPSTRVAPQVPEHVEEWVDLRLAEGYDGSIILEALAWVEHSLDSLPHVQRRLRRNESGLCADIVRPESIDFQFLCRNDRRWEAELYICAGEDENKAVEQRHSGVARTPLQLASESGCLNVVYLLLERHADVEAEDRLGRRPLHLAAQKGHTDVCVALVDSGDADVHAVDHDGNTPLHLAAKANKARTVHQLANIEEHQIREVLSGRLHPGMDREVPLMFSGLTRRPTSVPSHQCRLRASRWSLFRF